MILLHAIGLDGNWWTAYVERFKSSFTVVCPDLRGHGLSPHAWDLITLQDHANDISTLIASLGGKAHVVGVSMGGMVAQEVALRFPEQIITLSLLSTMADLPDAARESVAARGTPLPDGMTSHIRETVRRWVGEKNMNSNFAERCSIQLKRQNPNSWANNWRAISHIDTLSRLSSIRCRTLVATGSEDMSTPPSIAERIANAINQQSRQASVHTVPNAGHLGVFENPEPFLGLLANHLKNETN